MSLSKTGIALLGVFLTLLVVLSVGFCLWYEKRRPLPPDSEARPRVNWAAIQRLHLTQAQPRTVLSQQAVDDLPKRVYHLRDETKTASKDGATSFKANRECSICTEKYHRTSELRQLPCGHEFHTSCIDPWLLKRAATCPIWLVNGFLRGEK